MDRALAPDFREHLAERLCETLRALDPPGDIWAELPDADRDYYRTAVEHLWVDMKRWSLDGRPMTTA